MKRYGKILHEIGRNQFSATKQEVIVGTVLSEIHFERNIVSGRLVQKQSSKLR